MRKQAQLCKYAQVTKWHQSLSGTSRAGTFSEGHGHTSVYVPCPGGFFDLLEGVRAVFRVKSLRLSVEKWRAARLFAKNGAHHWVSVGGTHEQV
jgi:hypothetical protein